MALSSFVSAIPGLGDAAGAGMKFFKSSTTACKLKQYIHIVGSAASIIESSAVIGDVINRNLDYYLYSDEKHKFDAGQFAVDLATVAMQGFAIKGGVDGLKYAEATSWCFVGETLIAYENGQKRIDEIEVGDKVWAYDTETGKTELKEVQIVYIHDCDEILHLHTSCGDIDTTSNHPFYVIGKGWVTAGELEDGDEVYRLDGSTAVVTGSELERLTETIKVYNLEVEDYHTYFVGDVPVLVHNYEKAYKDEHGYWTNGTYRVDAQAMLKHTDYKEAKENGRSLFFFDVDTNQTILDAALYADENNLWFQSPKDPKNPNAFANKAKVIVTNRSVGVTGDGIETFVINLYRSRKKMVHGCPGNP